VGKTTARRIGREKAKPAMELIDEISRQLENDDQRRGFLAKLARSIYERRKPLYRFGLHANQKT
jgi:hypothetical protein